MKVAYYSYAAWVQRNGPERVLPELDYSQQQLFWISYAQMWCSSSRNYIIRNQIITDDHSPNEFRVNGAISNMPESSFSNDFHCNINTKMNAPSHQKCTVW